VPNARPRCNAVIRLASRRIRQDAVCTGMLPRSVVRWAASRVPRTVQVVQLGGAKGTVTAVPRSTKKSARVGINVGGLEMALKMRDIMKCAQAPPPSPAVTVAPARRKSRQGDGAGKPRASDRRRQGMADAGTAHDDDEDSAAGAQRPL
jgi:hypothetical protein